MKHKNKEVIRCIYSAHLAEGECYNVCNLLNHVDGPISFNVLKGGYKTEKEHTTKCLLEDDNDSYSCMGKVTHYRMPS